MYKAIVLLSAWRAGSVLQYVYVTNDVSVCLSLSTQFCNLTAHSSTAPHFWWCGWSRRLAFTHALPPSMWVLNIYSMSLLSCIVFCAIWVITTRENKHTCKHSEVEFSHSNQCTEHHSWICQLVFSPLPVDQHCMRTRTYQRWSPPLQFVLHSMIACWGMYM